MSESRINLGLKRDEETNSIIVYKTILYLDSDKVKTIELNKDYIALEKQAEWLKLGEDIREITPEMLDVFEQLNKNSHCENLTSSQLTAFFKLVKSRDYIFSPPSVRAINDSKSILPLSRVKVGAKEKDIALLSSLYPRLHAGGFFQQVVSKSNFEPQVLRLIHKLAKPDSRLSKEQGGQVGERLVQLIKETFPSVFPDVPLEVEVNYNHIKGSLSLRANYYSASEFVVCAKFTPAGELFNFICDVFYRHEKNSHCSNDFNHSRGSGGSTAKPGYPQVAHYSITLLTLSACRILIEALQELKNETYVYRKFTSLW